MLAFYKDNIKAATVPEYLPYWEFPFSSVQLCVEKSWNDVATYSARSYKHAEVTHPSLIKFCNEIKNGQFQDEEIVIKSLDFIHENIRYLSNHTDTDFISPSDPNITAERLYGDCKDFVHLLGSILGFFSIHSKPVLVHTRYGASLRNFLPALGIFDHIIILVKFNSGKDFFIDPTIRQKVDSLSNIYLPEYGYGLIGDETTHDLVEIRNSDSCPNVISVTDEYDVVSLKENDFIFKSTINLRGLYGLNFIRGLDGTPIAKVWESIKGYFSQFMVIKEELGKEIDKTLFLKNEAIYRVSYRVSIKDFSKDKSSIIYRFYPNDILKRLILPETVDSDFYYGPLDCIDYTIRVYKSAQPFRKGWGKKKVEEFSIVNDVFELFQTREPKYNGCDFHYHYKNRKKMISQDQYEAIQSDCERAINGLLILYKHDLKTIRSFLASIFSFIKRCLLVVAFIIFLLAIIGILQGPVDNKAENGNDHSIKSDEHCSPYFSVNHHCPIYRSNTYHKLNALK